MKQWGGIMYHIGQDTRQKKTADLLVDTMRRLLCGGSGKPVSAAELCRESGVSRSTFYRHFDSTDDVLRYLCDSDFDALLTDCIQHRKENGALSPIPDYVAMFHREDDIIVAMVRSGKVGILTEAHRQALRKYAAQLFPSMDPASEEFAFFVDMRTACITGALQAWVETGRKAKAEDIQRYTEEQLKFPFL